MRVLTPEPRPTAQPARVVVVGCGYVGLVTAVGLQEQGHRIYAFDRDAARLEALRRGELPIAEPGLLEAQSAAPGQLTFHHTLDEACPPCDFVFIAVPTPLGGDGRADLSYVDDVVAWLGDRERQNSDRPVVVIRSTAPPGTADRVQRELEDARDADVRVVSNPEFLQEGRALADFRAPSRVLVGGSDDAAMEAVAHLYDFTGARQFLTDTRSAEFAKYGANAFLALRISFANEFANLGQTLGVDVRAALAAVGADPRVGEHYLMPGFGYGGSCLPKDVGALITIGQAEGAPMALASAVREVNDRQRASASEVLRAVLGPLTDRRIALIGLAFKPHTNDLRDAPAIGLAGELAASGAHLSAWDPAVVAAQLDPALGIELETDLYAALTGAEAAVLCTEWPDALRLDFQRAAGVMAGATLLDGRYGWEPEVAAAHGLRVLRLGARYE